MKSGLMLWVGLLTLHAALSFAEAPRAHGGFADQPSRAEIKKMSDWLVAKRREYETTTSDLSAEDLRKIDALCRQEALALAVIDEVIALAEVRERPQAVTGYFAARSISPVARVLTRIGKPALPKIERALGRDDLQLWSALVLKDARRMIQGQDVDFKEVIYTDDFPARPRKERAALFAAICRANLQSLAREYTEDAIRKTLAQLESMNANSDLAGLMAGEVFGKHDQKLLLQVLAERIAGSWCAEVGGGVTDTSALHGDQESATVSLASKWLQRTDLNQWWGIRTLQPVGTDARLHDAYDPQEREAIGCLIRNANPFPREELLWLMKTRPDTHVRMTFLMALSRHEGADDAETRALLMEALSVKREGSRRGERACDEAYNEIMRREGAAESLIYPISSASHAEGRRDELIQELRRRMRNETSAKD